MSDVQNSKEKSLNKSKSKKKNSLLRYITIPLIFAVAALIITAPAIVKAENTFNHYIEILKTMPLP